MEIGTKIYYNIKSGEVICIIGDKKGDVYETTFDEDVQRIEFTDILLEEIGFINLDYGELAIFSEGAYLKYVDINTQEPVFEELTPPGQYDTTQDEIYILEQRLNELKNKK